MLADPSPTPPAVQLDQVSVTRNDTPILRDVHWTLPRGTRCTILGPNGSGKTTLTRVLTGYEWPTAGTATILGQTLGQVDVRQLRQRVQLVNPAARFGLDSHLTARDAVLTGYFASLGLYDPVSDEQRDQADHLLRVVGMAHRREHRLGMLSTGEYRRVLLARALVRIPEMLILDEPTAGLDVTGREHLLATISQLHRQPDAPTIITVTHHVEEIDPGTDQLLMLKAGRVAYLGSPDDGLTPETLSRLFDCKVYVQKRSGRWWLEVLPEAWLDLLRNDLSAGKPDLHPKG